jgi:hypothetical protein
MNVAQNIDFAPRRRGRPCTLTTEEKMLKHAQYMKAYYQTHKQQMNENTKRSYLKNKLKNNAPVEPVA